MDRSFASALARAEALVDGGRAGDGLAREDIRALIAGPDAGGPGGDEALFALADRVRRLNLGDAVHLRGVIEFSNHCLRQCHYCGLRAGNHELKRYRLTPEEIEAVAVQARELGYRTIVLQSGEDPWYDGATLARLIERVKRLTGAAVTVSVGDRSEADYRAFRAAGADRYLLKHETADAELFARLRPGTTLAERLERLHVLRDLGFQVGSGNIVGLPGQTLDSLADDISVLRELDVEMAGIGPFIPAPGTPLASAAPGDLRLTLRVLAVARLVLPLAHLPATTALATLYPYGRELALKCGANVVMPNVTPTEFRPLYRIYGNKYGMGDSARDSRDKILRLIREVGRSVAEDQGHSPKPAFTGQTPGVTEQTLRS